MNYKHKSMGKNLTQVILEACSIPTKNAILAMYLDNVTSRCLPRIASFFGGRVVLPISLFLIAENKNMPMPNMHITQ